MKGKNQIIMVLVHTRCNFEKNNQLTLMESLEKKLKANQEKINRMEKTLDKEEEKNKVMIKKIENKDY